MGQAALAADSGEGLAGEHEVGARRGAGVGASVARVDDRFAVAPMEFDSLALAVAGKPGAVRVGECVPERLAVGAARLDAVKGDADALRVEERADVVVEAMADDGEWNVVGGAPFGELAKPGRSWALART